jgi:hypothetical protein
VKKTYIITWAQNGTPVHAGFLASCKRFCEATSGELIVVAGRYNNPTSIWTKEQEKGEWWYDHVKPYLTFVDRKLAPNLMLYAGHRTQPTAKRPLTSLEVFVGKHSAIIGHPKRALETIPTATRMPRLLLTTSACTVPNYTDSRAGQHGRAHHVIGAVVVEIGPRGQYYVRHVTAIKDGSFTDLEWVYTPKGVHRAPRAKAVSLGDLHSGREDKPALRATHSLLGRLRPENIAYHDVLDFYTRNKHNRSLKDLYGTARLLVEDEVKHAHADICGFAARYPRATHHLVRSNHDEQLDQWLDRHVPHADPANAPFYFRLWGLLFSGGPKQRKDFPDAFARVCEEWGLPKNVHFLRKNERLRIGSVEYSFHGHQGAKGARAGKYTYANLGCKTVTGHTHSPSIRDGNFTAGVTAQLDHGYNDLPTDWLHAHVVHYADDKRTLITIIDGRYHA